MTEGAPVVEPIRVSFYVFFAAGGIGRYTHELASTLNASGGVDVEVACVPDFQWRGSPCYESWCGLMRLSHPIPSVRRARFIMSQFISPARFVRRAIDRRADVVHFSNINSLSYPFWRKLMDRTDLRVAVTAHDVKRRRAIISQGWEERGLRAFYRRADAIFVHSQYQLTELGEFAQVSPEKVHVVPHGPYAYGEMRAGKSEARLRFGLPEHREIALFFGHIRDDKNLDGLLRALAASRSRPHLVVAGQSASRNRPASEYRKLVQELSLDANVTFISRYIPDDEVGDLFTATDWVALPYSKSFTSQSGVLNVSAHYERPVLVGPSPVLRETLEHLDVGVACKDGSVADIARGIELMSARMKVGHRHQFEEYRQTFSWRANAERTLQVYRMLLEHPAKSK